MIVMGRKKRSFWTDGHLYTPKPIIPIISNATTHGQCVYLVGSDAWVIRDGSS